MQELLEEQLRMLTGQVEQAQHNLERERDRINSLSETINSRVDGVEEGLSAAVKKKARMTAGLRRYNM